jgi:hypothetical protein
VFRSGAGERLVLSIRMQHNNDIHRQCSIRCGSAMAKNSSPGCLMTASLCWILENQVLRPVCSRQTEAATLYSCGVFTCRDVPRAPIERTLYSLAFCCRAHCECACTGGLIGYTGAVVMLPLTT